MFWISAVFCFFLVVILSHVPLGSGLSSYGHCDHQIFMLSVSFSQHLIFAPLTADNIPANYHTCNNYSPNYSPSMAPGFPEFLTFLHPQVSFLFPTALCFGYRHHVYLFFPLHNYLLPPEPNVRVEGMRRLLRAVNFEKYALYLLCRHWRKKTQKHSPSLTS